MGRRARHEINKADESTTESDDERAAVMTCTQDMHYQCSDCKQTHTGNQDWTKTGNAWYCSHCTMVWNMARWDPWNKVPEVANQTSTSQSSTWLPNATQAPQGPGPSTSQPSASPENGTVNAIDKPVPDDDEDLKDKDEAKDEDPPAHQPPRHKQ